MGDVRPDGVCIFRLKTATTVLLNNEDYLGSKVATFSRN